VSGTDGAALLNRLAHGSQGIGALRERDRRSLDIQLDNGAPQHLDHLGEQLLAGPERQVSAPAGGPIAARRQAAVGRRNRWHSGHFRGPILSTMREMRLPAALLLACLTSASLAAAADTTLGSGVTLDRATPIADVIAGPATFAGRTVRVEGVVTAVCEHMGCWMTLAPAGAAGDPPATLRLKVEDGVIVFPVSARGRTAVAQGVVARVGGDEPHAADGADAAGAQAASASYQLEVTGAILR
jgi:hypothetical protein